MAIERQQGPEGGQDVVAEALTRRAHRSATVSPLGGTPRLYDPIPVYHLGLDDAERGYSPSKARKVGWWYPVIGGVEPAFALIEEAEGRPRFAGLVHGTLAKRLYLACDLVDRSFRDSAEHYEPRVFDIPALHLVSLWLVGNQDLFVPLMLGKPPGTAPLMIQEQIESRIKEALDRRSRSAMGGVAEFAADAVRPPTN